MAEVMIQRTNYACSCGRTKTIIDNLLRNGNDHFQVTPDSVPCECGERATPENVECPTCEGAGWKLLRPDTFMRDLCPDCNGEGTIPSPENVEYQTCDDCESEGRNCTAHGGRPGIPYPPENVDSPKGDA